MTNDKRIRILVLPSDKAGCGGFRSLWPHKYLAEHYSDDFKVDIDYGFANIGYVHNYFNEYDIVHFHKSIDAECKVLDIIHQLGKIAVCDVDDYWNLGDHHPMGYTSRVEGWAARVINHVKKADYVTTTTPIFAKEISKYNTNVQVLPNAIDVNDPQFQPVNILSKKIRVGLICGSSHLDDIKLLEGISRQLKPEVLDKIQFCLCGFDTRGNKTTINPQTGQKTVTPIQPNESVWCQYEQIITDNYRIVSPEYANYLRHYMNLPLPNSINVDDESYARYWTKDISEYATHYNNIDILLAPLVECDFNKMKSQLKAIEAGFFNKVLIAQNYGPYTIDLINGIERGGDFNLTTGNALLVDSVKNHKQWAKYIEKVVENPTLRECLQNNLHQVMTEKYSMENVTKQRVEFYKEIYNKQKNQ